MKLDVAVTFDGRSVGIVVSPLGCVVDEGLARGVVGGGDVEVSLMETDPLADSIDESDSDVVPLLPDTDCDADCESDCDTDNVSDRVYSQPSLPSHCVARGARS